MSKGGTISARVDNVGLHRFAVATSVAAFLLIIAGGLVTSTDSGLAVPDWPLSYGQFMPPMVGGIFYEHGHRILATAVGILTTILALWLWRRDERRWVRGLVWGALLMVIVQGTLGGITVLLLLPAPVSVLHATLAQSFFCVTVVIAVATSPAFRSSKSVESQISPKTQKLAIACTAFIFLQLVLGAIVRHTQSGLAIPDFPLSYGHLLPPLGSSEMSAINDVRLEDNLAPVELYQIWIHFAHRLGALITTLAICLAAAHVLNVYKTDPRLREPAITMVQLLVFQILLGAITVWTGKSIPAATAHVATGALLLGTSTILVLRSFAGYRRPIVSHDFALVAGSPVT